MHPDAFEGLGDTSMKREPFWLVWSPQGHAPTYQHKSERAAINEAKRLSRANPGRDFFVLTVTSGWTISEPPVQQLDIDPEFIPF